ncbi:hypothetical protein X975_11449, partial [Stegodyphus mimosarum]
MFASNGCSNPTSAQNNMWSQMRYNSEKKNNQEYMSHSTIVDSDSMGFTEKASQSQHLGPNFCFNSFEHENSDMPTLNYHNKIHQVSRHPRQVFLQPEGNICSYEDLENFSTLQKPQNPDNDLFNEPDFRFSDLDANTMCDSVDQQCFWTQDFGKQVSEALNMATSVASWP